jgi:CubicO group peptidase (beta-lactamase class C family)
MYPTTLAASPNTQPAVFHSIDAYVTAQMQTMHIPGIALGIVQGDQIVHTQGFGMANPSGQPMTPRIPLILGSTTKSFTALAVMQLVEAGKISLDAPVQHYLPWFQVAAPASALSTPSAASTITIRHLLNHISGIPTRAVEESLTGNGVETLEQEVRALSQVSLTAPVGTTYQYSNMNYATLGLVVQAVSGQSYGSYIEEHIFEPLQMANSFTSQTEARQHGMATGYRWWFGLAVPADLPYLHGSLPEGFLISSAEDMTHYLVAQMNNGRYLDTSVLSAGGIAQLHQPAVSMDSREVQGDMYGMGWVISPASGSLGVTSVWHGGDTANFHSDMIILPEKQLGIVVLMNVNGNFAMMSNAQGVIAHGIERILLGQPAPPASVFGQHYLWLDGILLLCSGLVLWSFVRLLRRRAQSLRQDPLNVLTSLLLPMLWEVALPAFLLIGFPPLMRASWPLILLYFPDFGNWLLVLCLILLATGTTRLVLAPSRLRKKDAPVSPHTPEDIPALAHAL